MEVEGISTGALSLDLALGGKGLPRGRIIELFGPESSGKTTIALHAVAQAQQNGGVAAFIDVLAATALVSGLLVPYIFNKIQVASKQQLKRYAADLARQSKIIKEQAALIRRISGLLWEFQLTLIAPIYYGQPGFRNNQWSTQSGSKTYEKATKDYLANASRLLGLVRAEIGAAVRLVPVKQWNTLKKLYYEELLPLDLRVTELIFEDPPARMSPNGLGNTSIFSITSPIFSM